MYISLKKNIFIVTVLQSLSVNSDIWALLHAVFVVCFFPPLYGAHRKKHSCVWTTVVKVVKVVKSVPFILV